MSDRVFSVRRLSGSLAARSALVLAISVFALRPLMASAAQPPVGLGKAASFAVLAGQGVTNTGSTVIYGNLGTSPAKAVTGFPPGHVHGAIHRADAFALHAKNSLTTAYNDAAGRTPVITVATELGGQTLTPGVYNSESGTFQITGTLTLDASGDPNGVFIFQTSSTLITASGSKVSLIGAASPCNVFWQIGSSATLGTGSTFRGNIMALTSIQVKANVTVIGRVMARNASVTLHSDVITAASCGANTTPPSQVTPVPSGGVQTGGGSTSGLQDGGLFVLGGAMLAAAAGTFALRRRAVRRG
jgi:Ice-binding-like